MKLLPLLCVLVAMGCRPDVDPPPVTAYRHFLSDLQQGQLKRAFEALALPLRTELTERAQKVSAASGGVLKPEPWSQIFLPFLDREVTRVSVKEQTAGRAVLEVQLEGGRTEPVSLVLEDGEWKIEAGQGPPPQDRRG